MASIKGWLAKIENKRKPRIQCNQIGSTYINCNRRKLTFPLSLRIYYREELEPVRLTTNDLIPIKSSFSFVLGLSKY